MPVIAMPVVLATLFSYLNYYDKTYGYTARRVWNELTPETQQSFVERDCLLLEQMWCGKQNGIDRFVHEILEDNSDSWFAREMSKLTTRQSTLELHRQCQTRNNVTGFVHHPVYAPPFVPADNIDINSC